MNNIELLVEKWSNLRSKTSEANSNAKLTNGNSRKGISLKSVVQHSLLIPVLAVSLVGCNTEGKQLKNSGSTPITPSTQSKTTPQSSQVTSTQSKTPDTSPQTKTTNGIKPIEKPTLVADRKESDLRANLKEVYFKFDSYALTASAKEKLLQMAQSMKNNQKLSIQISGYADERGTEEYNYNLGKMRAQAVKEFLVAQGVNPQLLSIKSYGEKKPAVKGSTSKAWQQNRRVDFKIVNSGI